MQHGHDHIHRGALEEIEEHRIAFFLAFIGLFIVSVVVLSALDVLPDPTAKLRAEHGGTQLSSGSQEPATPSSAATAANGNAPAATASSQEEPPVRVVADSIGLDVKVNNPASTNLDVLDNALLSGAVRYPTSAELGINGTVLLFGHSSYLPVVHNQSYKAFDGIQNLRTGDEISVYSATREYRYRVTGVMKKSAATDDSIPLPSDAAHLALVTCNSFGQKSDRFVVTADLAGTYSLVSN